VHFGSLDVQDCQTDTVGEKEKMITLASFSAFLGTFWFILLLCCASFAAGVVFKKQFLKLITGGKYDG
jgi:hypothetical protein